MGLWGLREMGPREGQEGGGLISDTSALWWDVNSPLGVAAKTLNHYRASVSAGERQGRWGRCGQGPNTPTAPTVGIPGKSSG